MSREEQIKKLSPFLTVNECAAYLGRPVRTIRKWVYEGRIPVRRQNGCVVFHVDEIEAWTRTDGAREESPVTLFQQTRQRIKSSQSMAG